MTFILVAAAAMFNAAMDRLENENFSSSIFKNLDPKFWYKRESWKYAKKIGGYKLDAWHLAKSCMIVCLLLAIVLFKGHWAWFISYGLLWNITFTIFYHEIFKAQS
jgi:hypothetical protein